MSNIIKMTPHERGGVWNQRNTIVFVQSNINEKQPNSLLLALDEQNPSPIESIAVMSWCYNVVSLV